jgi:SAM-dependent methyltransferase
MWLKADERGRLLDVGCGNGQFLAQMQKLGWEVMGVELDPEAVRIAEERFGLRVFQGTLEEARLPDGSFDTVTMNHVIEHVPNPIGLLAECRRILRPGGKLVVVTPNIESLGHRLFREAWRGLEVPRHLYIFSPRALQECAERAGLKVLKLWTTARSALWMWAASRLIRRNGILPGGSPQRLGLWLKLEGLAFWAIAYGLCALREAGEEIVLMASKGDEA